MLQPEHRRSGVVQGGRPRADSCPGDAKVVLFRSKECQATQTAKDAHSGPDTLRDLHKHHQVGEGNASDPIWQCKLGQLHRMSLTSMYTSIYCSMISAPSACMTSGRVRPQHGGDLPSYEPGSRTAMYWEQGNMWGESGES